MPTIAESRVPFPEAEPGQTRYVINLPRYNQDDERAHLQVMIIPSTFAAGDDDGARYVFNGKFTTGTVQGWGYSYWVLESMGDLVASRSSPNARVRGDYIPIHKCPVIPYNSKVPIVVYVPKGALVRYRIWADEEGRQSIANGPVEEEPRQGDATHSDREAIAGPTVVPLRDKPAGDEFREDWEGKHNQNRAAPVAAEERPENAREAAEAYPTEEEPHQQQQQREAYPTEEEPHQQPREAYPAQESAPALRAEEQERPEGGDRDNAYVEDAKPAPTSARRRSSHQQPRSQDLNEERLRQKRSSSTVVPLSATEETPSKVKAGSGAASKRGSTVSQRESPSARSKHRSGSTTQERSASTKKRNSSTNAKKDRLASDKYREL